MGKIVDISEADRLRKDRRKASEQKSYGGGEPRGKTALVLTGGGFTGGVYQIGALRAIDLLGVNTSVNDFDMVVGTSCGAFIGSLVANGARPEDMMALLDGEEVEGYEPLELDRLLRPNWRGLANSAMRLPLRSARIARRTEARSTALPGRTWPGPTRREDPSRTSRRPDGRTAAILARASRAAAPRRSSPRSATQREPSTSASISSSENMSGGSVKPGRST